MESKVLCAPTRKKSATTPNYGNARSLNSNHTKAAPELSNLCAGAAAGATCDEAKSLRKNIRRLFITLLSVGQQLTEAQCSLVKGRHGI